MSEWSSVDPEDIPYLKTDEYKFKSNEYENINEFITSNISPLLWPHIKIKSLNGRHRVYISTLEHLSDYFKTPIDFDQFLSIRLELDYIYHALLNYEITSEGIIVDSSRKLPYIPEELMEVRENQIFIRMDRTWLLFNYLDRNCVFPLTTPIDDMITRKMSLYLLSTFPSIKETSRTSLPGYLNIHLREVMSEEDIHREFKEFIKDIKIIKIINPTILKFDNLKYHYLNLWDLNVKIPIKIECLCELDPLIPELGVIDIVTSYLY